MSPIFAPNFAPIFCVAFHITLPGWFSVKLSTKVSVEYPLIFLPIFNKIGATISANIGAKICTNVYNIKYLVHCLRNLLGSSKVESCAVWTTTCSTRTQLSSSCYWCPRAQVPRRHARLRGRGVRAADVPHWGRQSGVGSCPHLGPWPPARPTTWILCH